MSDAGPAMREKVLDKLRELEQKHGVKIVYSCEAGSRAYGISTPSSDYDVRFIYVRTHSAYLSVRDTRTEHDVIHCAIDPVLDVSGWDIRKALQLLRTSNPNLLEWLGSPVVYRGFDGDGFDDGTCVAEMRRIATAHLSPRACMYHYYNWLRSKYEKNITGKPLKTFFYILRPVLAMRFLEMGKGVVPTLFAELVDGALDVAVQEEKALILACKKLAQDRIEGRDPTGQQHMKELIAFVDAEVKRWKGTKFPPESVEKVPFEVLDELFRRTLDSVW